MAGNNGAGDLPVRAIETVRITATGQQFEPLHNITPYGPPRHVSDYELTTTWAPARGQAQEDWHLFTIYPFPGTWNFAAVYHRDRGYRRGRDGFRPSAEGAVAPARIGAVFKNLWLSNPVILLAHGKALGPTPAHRHGQAYTRRMVAYNGSYFEVLSDGQTGLPAEVSTRERDPVEGEVTNRIVFSDWRQIAGIPFPFKLEQFIDGRLIRRETRRTIEVDATGADAVLALPKREPTHPDKALWDWGWSMSNFFLRRAAMGGPADNDQSREVRFLEVGPGLYQVLGSSHHNLLIVGPKGLAIVDAVWYPRRSRTILARLKERWPGKPLKYVILTHHHPDHTGGLAPFAAAGARIVVARVNAPYFSRILAKTTAGPVDLIAVDRKGAMDAIGRRIEAYDIPSSHADGSLAIYVPDAKLLFNADLFSPGRKAQSRLWSSELLRAIDFYGLDVAWHVGGHGHGKAPHQQLIDTAAGR